MATHVRLRLDAHSPNVFAESWISRSWIATVKRLKTDIAIQRLICVKVQSAHCDYSPPKVRDPAHEHAR
jgi:hypothetical protein